MELYEKIVYLRKLNGISQQEFADKINISRQSIYKWEQGLNNPDISKLSEIAKLLNVTTDLLLDDKISEKQLKEYVLTKNDRKAKGITTSNQRRSMLDYLLLIPAILTVGILVFMFYCFGALGIGFLYAFFISSIAAPFYGFIMIFVNVANGIAGLLICFSIIIGGLGLIYPLFLVARLWQRKYLELSIKLTNKIKNINWKKVF